MTKTPISLQDLRRNLYVKAKAEPAWRFWGLYVHVCKMETLHEAYQMARDNDGAPGIDGVTFDSIEGSEVESFLRQIRDALITSTYQPMRARKKEIPKDGGKVGVLSIPTIRDRVVQGALKLILEPIFEADFQPGSYGYRPKRTAHQAVNRVAQAIVESKTRIIDIDLRAYFDTVQRIGLDIDGQKLEFTGAPAVQFSWTAGSHEAKGTYGVEGGSFSENGGTWAIFRLLGDADSNTPSVGGGVFFDWIIKTGPPPNPRCAMANR
jgi:hypothetical protein